VNRSSLVESTAALLAFARDGRERDAGARSGGNREGGSQDRGPRDSGGRASVVHLPDHWFIVGLASELKEDPLATELFGTPLVVFRDAQGNAATLLDRCPHRNVPLSLGTRASDGTLQCAYHGWRFGGDGGCRFVPSRVHQSEVKARGAHAFPTLEQDGFIWVYSTPFHGDVPPLPDRKPHRFATMGAAGYETVVQVVEAEGTLYSTLENALDVPHTAFLHRGLFRTESRNLTITAHVNRTAEAVEAEYVGEPRPTGLVAKILSPSGGVVTHFDRFLLPSVAQVEYRIGAENHLLVDSVMTPLSDFRTRVYAVVSFRTRFPAAAVRPFVKPLALRIFEQDAFMLQKQTETIRTFGGEQFASTEIDVLGRHIWKLLRSAESGEPVGPDERGTVSLVV
jgi:phenylpropionate dioxygenase-like ring-hydroxylating dioxygenase large terminal subunit